MLSLSEGHGQFASPMAQDIASPGAAARAELLTKVLAGSEDSVLQSQLHNLFQEQNPSTFNKGLLVLAQRLVFGRQAQRALPLTDYLLKHAKDPAVLGTAKGLFKDIQGEGTWVQKTEGFVRDFLPHVTDPSMLMAFTAGGMSYRLLRFGALGKLLKPASLSTLSSLWSRQAAASTMALAGESLTFAGVSHATRGLSTLPHDPNASFAMTTAGTAITLGSLRFFGFGSGLAGGLLQKAKLAGEGSKLALSQMGMYGGLLAAQKIEHGLLYPDQAQTGNPWLTAAASLIHFNAAGLIARGLTPKSWQALEHSLEQRTHKLLSEKAQQIRDGIQPDLGGFHPRLQAAGTGTLSFFRPLPDPKTFGLFRISGKPGKRDPYQFNKELPEETRAFALHVDAFIDPQQGPFLKTLAQTKLTDVGRIDLAARRFHHIFTYGNPDTAHSTYLNWITLIGLKKIVEKRDSEALDQLITMITQPTPIRDIENFLSRNLGHTSLPKSIIGIGGVSKRFKKNSDYRETVEELPLSYNAKEALWLLLKAQQKGRDSVPFYINPHEFLNQLGQLRRLNDRAKWTLVQSILEKTSSSPLGILRLGRLHLILRSELSYDAEKDRVSHHGLLGPKLRDLHNDKYQTSGPLPNPILSRDVEVFNGPHGAFLGQYGPWELLRDFIPQIPDLIDPAKEVPRRERRRKVIGEFLASHSGNTAYRPENIAEAYFHLSQAFKGQNFEERRGMEQGDFSYHLALAIQRGDFKLEVLDKQAYLRRYNEINKQTAQSLGNSFQEATRAPLSYFFNAHPNVPIREKPIILLTRPVLSDFSPESILDSYFELLGMGVHEGEHFFQAQKYPNGQWNEGVQMKEETATFSRQLWWEGQHGSNVDTIRNYLKESPTGFTTRLLDRSEKNYRKYWRD